MKIKVTNTSDTLARKAGINFPAGESTFKEDAITRAQLAQVVSHPDLEVSLVEDEPKTSQKKERK